MLRQSDRPIELAVNVFKVLNIEVGLFSPTATGLKKSIFDAHNSLVRFFNTNNIHNFESQPRGVESKSLCELTIVTPDALVVSQISFNRPDSKNGDPRFWIRGIRDHCTSGNLLCFFVLNEILFLTNLSDEKILSRNDQLQLPVLDLLGVSMDSNSTLQTPETTNMNQQEIYFPKGLVEWAGHHSGGVKRLFDHSSGRPSKDLLKTNLINRLETWAVALSQKDPNIPRVLFLVGGPGNGKTEAIENTIKKIDEIFNADGQLVNKLAQSFHPKSGNAVPRIVTINTCDFDYIDGDFRLDIVQDATTTVSEKKASAAKLLLDELDGLLTNNEAHYYLCCINRGVLDEALIEAIEDSNANATHLLEEITKAVSVSSHAPQCWPLQSHPNIAVWPMDVESLLVPADGNEKSAAFTLITHAVKPTLWKPKGTCSAGELCPFCNSQAILTKTDPLESLLKILRWYELASGKRWSFRDLFSLVSYLLSGHRPDQKGTQSDPCEWARNLWALDNARQNSATPSKQELTAIFYLATSGYQHALFHQWNKDLGQELAASIKELGISKANDEDKLLHGFQQFMTERKSTYLPATISALLNSISELLDPALANPTSVIRIGPSIKISLGELDARFSKSVQGGLDFIRSFRVLSNAENDLLVRIANTDQYLSSNAIRRKKPTAATYLQRCLRDFSCRFVRRSICTRLAVVADLETLNSFQKIVEDDHGNNLHEIAKQVKALLNNHDGFHVSLTTTFGQPLPPIQRQTTLIVPTRNVRPLTLNNQGRPKSPICYLKIGTGKSVQAIALTYELFHAIKELERGLSPASLSRNVLALLDTTKAKLSGAIVRDYELWEDAKIGIGADGTEIVKSFDGFVSLSGAK